MIDCRAALKIIHMTLASDHHSPCDLEIFHLKALPRFQASSGGFTLPQLCDSSTLSGTRNGRLLEQSYKLIIIYMISQREDN